MKRNYGSILLMICMLFSLTGCGPIGDKTANMGILYGITTLLALFLIIAYGSQIRKKDPWFLLLFSSVFVVNLGYFSLAISSTLEEALLANRISYFGSVFLPLSMLFIIMNVCKLKYTKWFVGIFPLRSGYKKEFLDGLEWNLFLCALSDSRNVGSILVLQNLAAGL